VNLNLDFKEKIALFLGIVASLLVLLLLLYVPMGPRKWYQASERELASLKNELQMQTMFRQEEADRLEKQKILMEKLDERAADFSLFTYIENLLNNTNMRNRAQLEEYKQRNASPKQPMVQLRLQGVEFKELVDFLYQVYSSTSLVAVYKMDYLRPAPSEKGLDCDLTFVTLIS
jgi:hypothetical protein